MLHGPTGVSATSRLLMAALSDIHRVPPSTIGGQQSLPRVPAACSCLTSCASCSTTVLELTSSAPVGRAPCLQACQLSGLDGLARLAWSDGATIHHPLGVDSLTRDKDEREGTLGKTCGKTIGTAHTRYNPRRETSSQTRRLSKSGNFYRFFPDARFGTDCGRTVRPVLDCNKSYAARCKCAAHISNAMLIAQRVRAGEVPD